MSKCKCLACNSNFVDVDSLYTHYDKVHEDAIPKDFTPAQYHYFLKTGKSAGSCVVCKRDTMWNDSTNKYHRFCGRAECKKKYVDEFRKRMIGAHGTVHLLNDPDQQRKMLANRSISGEYIWSDGKKVGYTGSYEKDFLQFLDVFMEYSSEDIMSPSPHTYTYMHEGVERFYIPDFFIPSLNLEIEVKDGGDNPNNHHKIQAVDKEKERLKDKVMLSQKEFSYIKIINKQYDAFVDALMEKKKQFAETGSADKPIFILENATDVEGEIVTESMGDITLAEIETKRKTGHYNLFHISEEDLDGKVLRPRIPNNFMVKNGYEEGSTPRVAFSTSIDSCLVGLSQNLAGKVLHVYEPILTKKIKTHSPTTEEVPDAYISNEVWVLEPVRLKRVRTIRVLETDGREYKYKYGNSEATLYSWSWVDYRPDEIVEESSKTRSSTHKYPVYVILTHSGTTLSNVIKKVTKDPYSHASISFTPDLNSMYSFGRKYKDNPFIGTFVKEDINAGLFNDVKDTATYSLYLTWVTEAERDAMMARLSEFTSATTPFKYNFTGLIKHKLGKESHREDAYFCSEFVDTILKSGSPYFNKHSSLVKPYDFALNKHFQFVTRGRLKGYDARKVQGLVNLMTGGK